MLSLCFQDKPWLCQECSDDGDCAGPRDRCVMEGERGYCAADCSLTGWCPEGYVCSEEAGDQCRPSGGWCDPCGPRPRIPWCRDRDGDGFGDPANQVLDCERPDGFSERCDDCDDRDPEVYPGATERCDGRDDDCDGQTDEIGCDCVDDTVEPCGPSEGVCEPGTRRCVDGRWTDCEGGVGPAEELCNGLDDDCDGQTDEDYGVGLRCFAGLGACRREGVMVCSEDGLGIRCDAEPGEPAAQEACDGLDDDCDGLVDEGCEDRPCPPDMVLVDGTFCMDAFEASRADATEVWPGSDEQSPPVSRPGVIPWTNVSFDMARAACQAAGKRLCTPEEWTLACRGPEGLTYSYGNVCEPQVCNGIDAFCPNPTPLCYREHRAFHMAPTGSFPGCTGHWGVYDINGNVWEFDGLGRGRGGAYNCSDSCRLHQCTYLADWGLGPKRNFGFRCCKEPVEPAR